LNIALWLQRTALLQPHHLAIAHGTQPWATYLEFAERAARTAHWLDQQGVQAGDRVALFMANRPDYLELMWGVWWRGAVAVPINAKLHPREAAWIMQHSGSRLAFCDGDNAAGVVQGLHDLAHGAAVHTDMAVVQDPAVPTAPITPRAENDAAWLFYTSGTTGRPKGVTLAARQLRWGTMGYLAAIQSVGPGDVMLHPAPMSHGGGLYHLPYVLNGGVNVVPASGGFDAVECLALAAHWQRASFFAAPTMVRRLVDTAKRAGPPTGLSTLIFGGGPMYLADLEDALHTLGGCLAQIYGQGECPMTITVLPKHVINQPDQPRYRERLASVGFAQAMVEVSVRDAQGQPLPAGTSGEVCVKGDVVMEGYWQDPEATAKTIRDGWLYTGDIGRLDEDGFLTLLDRSKDLIISGGSNIYPREVEEALLTHPGVAEVAVIGRPDPEWGEVVVAYVVTSSPVEPTALDAHCIAHIARFKRPKHYRFVQELPKNNYGKVLKTQLRTQESQHPPR